MSGFFPEWLPFFTCEKYTPVSRFYKSAPVQRQDFLLRMRVCRRFPQESRDPVCNLEKPVLYQHITRAERNTKYRNSEHDRTADHSGDLHVQPGALPETVPGSVFASRELPAEVLVMNDGSTDATPETVAAFGERVKGFYQENQGLAAARKALVKRAQPCTRITCG